MIPSPLLAGSLRGLAFSARVGLSALLAVVAAGLLASGAHVVNQHENRDERPGVSLVDLEGAYHGVQSDSLLLTAIERGHPEELLPAERELLLGWLRGKRLSEDYDSLELGDDAPAEVLARRCGDCHSRAGLDGAHADAKVPLGTWDEVSKLAFSRRIEPLPTRVLAASTHAHALALAPLGIVLCCLLFATRFGARLGGPLCLVNGVSLALDLGGWWLARERAGLAGLIAASGALFALSTALALLLVLADLWLPRRAPQ